MQLSCHPCIDKIFSWLQEEVSINIVNEIENCLLLRSAKVIVYGLPLEDVASYRSKMIHLIEVRCIIFQRMPVQLVYRIVHFSRKSNINNCNKGDRRVTGKTGSCHHNVLISKKCDRVQGVFG